MSNREVAKVPQNCPAAQASPGARTIFDHAFTEYREPLYRYMFTLTGNVAEAEDLMQECFLRLNQELQAERNIENVKAWLLRTGHNLAIDHHRRTARSGEDRLGEDAMQLADQKQLSPDILLERERATLVRAAMARLTVRQRTCLRLRAGGLRYKNIAAVLGIGEASVCEHLRRGLARLRKDILTENL